MCTREYQFLYFQDHIFRLYACWKIIFEISFQITHLISEILGCKKKLLIYTTETQEDVK